MEGSAKGHGDIDFQVLKELDNRGGAVAERVL
jgi:hypothetical protein